MTIYRKSKTLTEFVNISKLLSTDEQLMRLLTYMPESMIKGVYTPDPLDPTLPDVVDEDSDEYWECADDRVVIGEKVVDLEGRAICRICLYEGRRRPVFENYVVADQDICIDIYIHESFNTDLRIARISDRINELIALKYVAGMGRVEYRAGNPREAQIHYRRYLHNYTILVGKR